MSYGIKTGATDQIALFRAYDNDGNGDPTIPKTDLTSASAGLSLSVFRVGASAVAIASLSDKAADDTAHADGAIRAISGNLYSVDLPDAAQATQVPGVCIEGSLTGGAIEGEFHPLVGYDVTATAVGANTATPLDAAGVRSAIGMSVANLDTQLTTIDGNVDDVLTNLAVVDGVVDAILVDTGTSIPATLVTIASDADTAATESTANGVTLINAFPTNFSSLLINGSGHISRVTLADEVTTVPWQASWDAEVQSECNDALVSLSLDNALIAQGATRSVSVDNSHRVHSHVYDMQANTVTASALASDAVTEIQSGLATASALTTVDTNVSTLLTRIPAALFNGITSLASWLGALAGKTADTSTRTEINATTAGAGYNETTDSQEAIRDRGDAAWTPSGGSSTISQGDIDAIVQGVTAVGEQVTSASTSITQLTAGDDWDQEYSITVLGSPDEVVYMLKHEMDDADNDAVLWVSSSTGLVRLNGEDTTASASEASLTVNASDVTLVVDSSISVQIPTGNFVEGIKKLVEGGDFHYRTNGPVRVVRGTIREAS